MSLLLKEEKVAECLTSWGGDCSKCWDRSVRKCERVLRLKRWSLSMRVSDEERREREAVKIMYVAQDVCVVRLL